MYFSCAAHSICGDRIGISSCLPRLQPQVDHDKIQHPEQLSQVLQRLLCGASFFDCVGSQCLSQLLQEHPPLVLLIRHPDSVDRVPYHEGIVWHNDVMEDDQGPAGSHPPATVCSNHLVQVVHPLLCSGCSPEWWLASCPHDHWSQLFFAVSSGGPHSCSSLGGKKLVWWWGWRQTLMRRPLSPLLLGVRAGVHVRERVHVCLSLWCVNDFITSGSKRQYLYPGGVWKY